jgi:hypothetical protein
MRKTRAKGELHLDRPLQVIVSCPIEDHEEHGSFDFAATEYQYEGISDMPASKLTRSCRNQTNTLLNTIVATQATTRNTRIADQL